MAEEHGHDAAWLDTVARRQERKRQIVTAIRSARAIDYDRLIHALAQWLETREEGSKLRMEVADKLLEQEGAHLLGRK